MVACDMSLTAILKRNRRHLVARALDKHAPFFLTASSRHGNRRPPDCQPAISADKRLSLCVTLCALWFCLYWQLGTDN